MNRLKYFLLLETHLALGFIRKSGYYKSVSVYDILLELGIKPWIG